MNNRVIVRGGGDIASGTIQKLHRAGFKVLVLEIDKPTTIRRKAAFSEAVYDGVTEVEGLEAVLVSSEEEILRAWEKGKVPLAVDPKGELIDIIKPIALVDAILAKKNLGTTKDMAPITIALGPGFKAGLDAQIVIETMRGHDLGRLIFEGHAKKNTGSPGIIGGYDIERVIYSPYEGKIKNLKEIGDLVEAGETIAFIEGQPVETSIPGVLRGIIKDDFEVNIGLKIADVDPRLEQVKNCTTISDKARTIGGGVLEGILIQRSKFILTKSKIWIFI
ncbi:MAG: selenium-dependent molybdenum cofactor biosynthesis protein YqeB [Clostridium sp.]